MMGSLKYLVTTLAALSLGWDLRSVDWNPIAYVQDPDANHTTTAMLAILAVLAWLIDRWTSGDEWRPPRISLPVVGGWLVIAVLLIQNVLTLDGTIVGLIELPQHISFWLLVVAVLGTCWLCSRQQPRFAQADTHGSAAWATTSDIKPLLAPANRQEPGSLVLAYDQRKRPIILPHELARRHTLLLGTSGSGKTRTSYMRMVSEAGHSLVATDPKGELWRYTSGYQQEAWRMAPMRPDSTHGLNWIPLCRDERVAQLLAAAVMQGEEEKEELPFWKLNDKQLCSALFTHVAHMAEPTPATLYALLELGTRQLIEHLLTSPVARARTCAQNLAELRPESRAGIFLSMTNKLAFLQEPAVRRFTSQDLTPPDFRMLVADPDRPIAVYWQVHEQDAELLKPLSSLFFTLLLDQLTRGEEDEELPAPVALFLDEFAQIGRIPHFSSTIVVARGRGLALVIGIQSLAQLDEIYGTPARKIIIDNCTTKMVLPGLGYDTAEQISLALGETTVRQEYQSRKPEGLMVTSYSYGEHHTQRRLLTADEVRRIGNDEVLLIIGNFRPIRARRVFWNKPPNPAPAVESSTDQPTVVREDVAPPPPNTNQLRSQLENLKEDSDD